MIKGEIKVVNREKEWRFMPNKKWEKGIYILKINSRLEDSVGNNLNGLFDHEIGSLENSNDGEVVELKIKIE